MANFLKDNDDLGYYLEKGVDWDQVARVVERDFSAEGGFADAAEARQFYRDILEMVGEFVADQVAPHALEIDREGVRFDSGEAVFPERLATIFERIKELELHGMCLPRELGGQNAPLMLYFLSNELFARGEVSVMAHHGFHGGVALTMLQLSQREGTTKVDPHTGAILETRFADYIEEIRNGEAWGCMDITEPDAGSDMAALKTVAEQDEDGNWLLSGQKIFITSGHGKYHFVIARTEKPSDADDPMAGLGGLSMFMVKAYEDDEQGNRTRFVSVDRIEEKMGHHGSATAALSFERTPAQLIGKRGEGFPYMLTLMNNARISVGFECLGLCEAAYRLARDYAAERRSMGKSIDRHEMIADYLEEMQTDIQGLRALAIHGAFHEEQATRLGMQLSTRAGVDAVEKKRVEQRIAAHKAKARRVTPLVKYLGAERAVLTARRAVQILGGNGYIKEYGAEKLLRDALVMPIYEGTSQIQALMAMKDTLGGIMKNPQEFIKRIAQTRWRSLSARDPLERRLAKLELVSLAAQQHLMARTAGDKFKAVQGKPFSEWPGALFSGWDPKRDFAYAMLHAERLVQILADEAACQLLWQQAERHPERREVFERYLERAEPRSRYLLDEITSTGQRLLARLGSASDEDDEQAAS